MSDWYLVDNSAADGSGVFALTPRAAGQLQRFAENYQEGDGSMIDRDSILDALAAAGYDRDAMSLAPDPVLAECSRMLQQQPGGQPTPMDDGMGGGDQEDQMARQYASAMAPSLARMGRTPQEMVKSYREYREKLHGTQSAAEYFCQQPKEPTMMKFAEGTPEDVKVQRFVESDAAFQHVLKIQGKTPAQYLAKFRELRAKKPTLSAREYGVPC